MNSLIYGLKNRKYTFQEQINKLEDCAKCFLAEYSAKNFEK